MEVVFHTGKESNQHLREFAEKRADFVFRELRDCGAKELKVLLRILQEENPASRIRGTVLVCNLSRVPIMPVTSYLYPKIMSFRNMRIKV